MGLRRLHPRAQGDLGEASAIEWFAARGCTVSFPLFHSPDYDVVVEMDGVLRRVQVKTSAAFRAERYEVTLATRGSNQSGRAR